MAPSPFILGTHIQWAWDSTSLGWLKECPRKYYYHMVQGYVGKHENIHLEFGILYHSALETYDRLRLNNGYNHDAALRTVVAGTLAETWRDGRPWRASADLDPDDRASLKCRENLIRSIVWYLDKFPLETDPARTLLASDTGLPMVELHFQFQAHDEFHLCGYLDRVVDYQGEKFVMDRKTTTTTLSSYYFQNYSPDNQMSLYSIAADVAFHTPVQGVIVDAVQIAVGFSRYGRAFAHRTKAQLDEWLGDFAWWTEQASRYSDAGHWPMNDKSCGNYGGCAFRAICSKDPSVRDVFLRSNFDVRQWNPLVPR